MQRSPFLTNTIGNSGAGGLQATFLESPTYINTLIRFEKEFICHNYDTNFFPTSCLLILMVSIMLKNELDTFKLVQLNNTEKLGIFKEAFFWLGESLNQVFIARLLYGLH